MAIKSLMRKQWTLQGIKPKDINPEYDEIIQLSIAGGMKFPTLHFLFQNLKTFSNSFSLRFNSKWFLFSRQSECWSIWINSASLMFLLYIILYRKHIAWLWLSKIKIGGKSDFSIRKKFLSPWKYSISQFSFFSANAKCS